MAASITGTFTIIDRATAPMRRMERQAVKTQTAIESLGASMDKIGTNKQMRQIEQQRQALRNLGRESDSAAKASRQHEQQSRRTEQRTATLAQSLRKLGGAFVGLKAVVFALKWPAMIAGFGMLVQVAGAAGAGIVALIPRIADLSGVLAALPFAVGAAAQGLLTFKLAFSGVSDALKAGLATHQNAARAARDFADQQRAAAQTVRQAEQGLMMAQRQSIDVQRQLTEARRSARRELVDMKLAAEGGALAEKRASLSLKEARQALSRARSTGVGGTQLQDLTLSVSEAQLGLKQSRIEARRQKADSRRTQQRGVGGNVNVIQAQRAVTDAASGQTDAMWALNEAMIKQNELLADGPPAQRKYLDSLKRLSPEAQRFVKHLVGMRGVMKGLKREAGRDLFPGLTRALDRAKKGVPALSGILRNTGGVIGRNAAAAAGEATTPGRLSDVTRLGHTQTRIIDQALQGVRNLIPALVDFMIAAQPFVRWLSRTLLGWTKWAKEAAHAGRVTGTIRGFLNRTRTSLELFGRVAKNSWGALRGLGKAARPLGDDLYRSIDRGAKRWNEWANSMAGQVRMRLWFTQMRPVIHELVGLVGDLAKALARLAADPSSVGFIKTLRGMVPSLETAIRKLRDALGGPLLSVFSQIAKLLANLSGVTGPITLLLKALGRVLGIINSLISAVPGLGAVLSAALSVVLLNRFIGRVKALRDLWASAAAWAGRAGGGGAAGGAGGAGGGGGGGGLFGLGGGATKGYSFKERLQLRGMAGADARAAAAAGGAGRLGQTLAGARGAALGVGGGAALAGAKALGVKGLAKGAGGMALKGLRFAGKAAWPLMAAMGIFDFATASGGVGNRSKSALSGATFGLTNKVGFLQTDEARNKSKLAASQQHIGQLLAKTGGDAPKTTAQLKQQIDALQRELATTQKLGKAGKDYRQSLYDQATVRKDLLKQIQKEEAAQRRLARAQSDANSQAHGQKLTGSFKGAYRAYSKGGMTPVAAMAATQHDVMVTMSKMRPAGARVLGDNMLAWAKSMERKNPALVGVVDKLAASIKRKFSRMGQHVEIVNGQILSGSTTEWKKIGKALSDPAERARQKVSTAFTAMQEQAVGSLMAMGYKRGQARSIIKGLEGGSTAAAMDAAQGPTGAGQRPSVNDANRQRGRARGGRIPGAGLHDHVPLGKGGVIGAPGELVVNRHTESRLRRKYGVNLASEVNAESKPHNAPMHGVMPGLAKGGRIADATAFNLMAGRADAIDKAHYPYLWGGGHDPGFTPPYDCSGAVSSVLHKAGVIGSPLTSSGLMGIGDPGPGGVSIFANAGHAFMSLGGRGFGTATSNPGGGAGWLPYNSRPGFAVRHIPGISGGSNLGSLPTAGSALGGIGGIGAPSTGLAGAPGAMGDATLAAMAAGLNNRINGAGGGGGAAGAPGGAVAGGVSGWLTQALRITGHYTPANLAALSRRAMQESSGNPHAQNNWDINAKNGDPSRGLLQTIGSTFNSYKMPGHGDIWNPVDNAISAIRYMYSRYGHIMDANGQGYALGGRIPFAGWHAKGGTFDVSSPTIFGAGEKGTETVKITPKGKKGGGGAGGAQFDVTVHIANYNVEGQIADAMKREFAKLADDLQLITTGEGT